jgi:hypothetical protein
MAPAHEACALAKTQEDHRRAGRAKRQKIRHIGADEPNGRCPSARRVGGNGLCPARSFHADTGCSMLARLSYGQTRVAEPQPD